MLQNKGVIYIKVQAYTIASPFRGSKSWYANQMRAKILAYSWKKLFTKSVTPESLCDQ